MTAVDTPAAPEVNSVPATQPVSAAVAKRKGIAEFLSKNSSLLKQALPNIGITPERIIRTALTAVNQNPTLLECDRASLMKCLVEAAQLGIEFTLGRGYLVPYKGKATLIVGYLGLLDLARRSGDIKSVSAAGVYEGDEFTYSRGLEVDDLSHVSKVDPAPEKLTAVYCIVRFKSGGYQFGVMTRKQVDAVRARSAAKNNGPWVTDYEAMAIKTVMKRTLKFCPMSIEMARAISLDDGADAGEQHLEGMDDFMDAELVDDQQAAEEPKKSTTQTITERVRSTKKEADKAIEKTEPQVIDFKQRSAMATAVFDAFTVVFGMSKCIGELMTATQGEIKSKQDLTDKITPAMRDMLVAYADANDNGDEEAPV